MDKRLEIKIFTEELWERVEDLRIGSGLTDADVVKALELVRQLLLKRINEAEDE